MAKKQPDPIDVHVGHRVRQRRIILGISQEKLGESIGVTFQQVQKYERGTNRISASRLQHIANILSVPVPYFFEEQASDQTASSGTEADNDNQTDFLSSPQAFRLSSAFLRIKDAKVRRAVIDIISALGEQQEAVTKQTPSPHAVPTPDESS